MVGQSQFSRSAVVKMKLSLIRNYFHLNNTAFAAFFEPALLGLFFSFLGVYGAILFSLVRMTQHFFNSLQ
jgi:hypothetical protein